MTGQEKKQATHYKIKIKTDPRWATRAVVAIYRYQTEHEKYLQETVYHNRVGFNARDAEFCSSIARQVIAGRALSPKQLAVLHRVMPKYAGQLVRIVNGKQGPPPA